MRTQLPALPEWRAVGLCGSFPMGVRSGCAAGAFIFNQKE